jgi:hypothetical protein
VLNEKDAENIRSNVIKRAHDQSVAIEAKQ